MEASFKSQFLVVKKPIYTTPFSDNQLKIKVMTCRQFYAWTSASSGGSGVLGCLLSKCCLKVLGSGIWVWLKRDIKLYAQYKS